MTETNRDDDGFVHELTPVQREYVDKLYKREAHGDVGSRRYRSVIFGKYEFQPGDDPYDLSRDWPIDEKPGHKKAIEK